MRVHACTCVTREVWSIPSAISVHTERGVGGVTLKKKDAPLSDLYLRVRGTYVREYMHVRAFCTDLLKLVANGEDLPCS